VAHVIAALGRIGWMGRTGGMARIGKTAATFVAIAVVGSSAPRAARQAEPAANAAFEAASIKPSAAARDEEPSSMVMPGGRYVATNVTLRRLLRTAYYVQETQIVGGPAWLDSERFDVHATADRNTPAVVFREQFRPLLAALLRDRFHVTVHKDVRVQSAYALVVSRRDGRLGARLHQSSEECVTNLALRQAGKPVPQPPQGVLPCGAWYTQPGHLEGRGVELGRLVETLAPQVDRVVVDRTRLRGLFDWDLKWLPGAGADAGSDLPASIFTALNEQLGLKLDSRKLPVDVFVIDRAEHLTAN
jgi:uncharacterized protein (TIGR03435 family)